MKMTEVRKTSIEEADNSKVQTLNSNETISKSNEGADSKVDQKTEEILNSLKGLSISDRSKVEEKLNQQVGRLLSESWLTREKIQELYKELSLSQRQNLEKVFELANLENETQKLKQREVNALIDLIKAGLNDLNHQVLGRVTELYEEGKYQQALDTAWILASKGKMEVKVGAYNAVKAILRNAPQDQTLKLLDKTISVRERDAWIKKMEQNIADLKREQDEANYRDVSLNGTSAFELDTTQAAKETSEKKVLKEKSKELQKILKNLNDASALSFIESNYSDIKSMQNIETGLTKEYLKEKGYLPKNGKEIKNSELQAMKNLFYYKWHYSEDAGKNNEAEKLAYEQIKATKIAGVSMAEVAQAKQILDQISVSSPEHIDALKVLLGDKNRDGKITNVNLENEWKRENVDKGTLFGGQIAQMLENALFRFEGDESRVVKNIANVIAQLHGLETFELADDAKIKDLIAAFKARPEALIAFRKKLLTEPDSGMSMFYAGTEYAKMRVDKIKTENEREEKAKAFAQSYFENPENFNKLQEFESQVKEKQKADLDQVRTNLQKIKDSDAFNKLNSDQKNQIENLLKALSPEKVENLLNTQEMKEARKGLILSGIGAALSAVEYQGEWNLGAGVGAALTHEKINEVIAKSKVFDSLSAGTGLYMDASGFSLGLGLSLNGEKDLGKETRMFYSLGAGTNLLQPKGLGVNAVLGGEKLLNKKTLEQSLDKKSAQYLGVVGSAGVGIDLSSGDFDPSVLSFALQGYWRKDKLEGIEKQAQSLKDKVQPIFAELLSNVSSVDEVAKKLKEKFPKTKGDTLYETAVALYNTVKSYEAVGKDVKDQLSSDFAQYLAQNWRNENIEEIVKEGWHISQLGVGANLSLAKFFTGFFGIGSLAVTKYTDAKYEENQDMLKKAQEAVRDGNNFERIKNHSETLTEKLHIINNLLKNGDLLQQKTITEKEESWKEKQINYISLDKKVFDKSIKVMCTEELAPYIHQKDGEIQLPFNADISLAKILHQGRESRTLILGAKGITGTKEISLTSGKLEFVDKDAKPEASQDSRSEQQSNFGTKALDTYNLQETIVATETDVQLDGKPNDELVKYLEENGDALVNFRIHKTRYDRFMQKMAHWDRSGDSLEEVNKLLPPELAKNVNSVDDVRFVYASLSRVSQTRDKQLENSDLADKANEYLNASGLKNNPDLQAYIEKVGKGEALDDAEWAKMKSLLKIPNGWHYYNINTPAGKLFHILTPVQKLAEARSGSYTSKITKEYAANGPEGSQTLLEVRKSALEKLHWKPTAKGSLQEWWIGAVAGYDAANEIQDKFVSAPKMIDGSVVDISGDGVEAIKRQYLKDLLNNDKTQFDYIKSQILTQIDGDTSDAAQSLRSAEGDAFIDAMLTAKTKNNQGQEVNLVTFDMKYGFFADCVNETILLGNLKVNKTVKEQKPADGDVYYFDAVVTNDAVTTAKTLGVAVVAGSVKDKGPKWSTTPEVQEWGKTEPMADLDELNNDNVKVVDGENITIEGKTYTYQLTEMPDGNDGIVVYSGDEVYQMFKVDGKVTLYPLDQNGNAILPQNAIPVNPTSPVVVESSASSLQPNARLQVAQLLHMLNTGHIKKRIKK